MLETLSDANWGIMECKESDDEPADVTPMWRSQRFGGGESIPPPTAIVVCGG